MADVASSTLLQWELTNFEGNVSAAILFSDTTRQSESGIVRLVKTACKTLCKHGSKQSGVYQPITAFLATNGIKKNLLVSFWGNVLILYFMMLEPYITYFSMWSSFSTKYGRPRTSCSKLFTVISEFQNLLQDAVLLVLLTRSLQVLFGVYQNLTM